MNLVWEAKYEKEENLMHLNGIELRELYSSSSTPANMKHLIAKIEAYKEAAKVWSLLQWLTLWRKDSDLKPP